MKKIIPIVACCLVIVLTLSSFQSYSQTLDCSSVKDGVFKIEGEFGVSIITRKGEKQTETMVGEEGQSEFVVDWIDDCTYTLTPTAKTLKKLFADLPADAQLTVTITSITENGYFQTTTSNFADFELSSEMVREK